MKRFADLVASYDGFIFDQYGVLHDGRTLYPGAIDALESCAVVGKPVVLVTNSGRTAAENAERLKRLGLDPSLFSAIVTSGDLAQETLTALNARATYILARGSDPVRGAGPQTSNPEEADLLLIAGSETDTVSEAHYRDILGQLSARDVPALCSNPDMQMLTSSGLKPGAGQIAAWYQHLGGTVAYVGKPWPEIYEAALRALCLGPGARICALGDSIHHDILGANRAGLSSALVLTGVGADLTPQAVSEMASDDLHRPAHILRSL
ncbi:MAG: TIGR01459 family HAD-type hydrolase [Rhizobiaceae bacterium]|nr:TIGR01459 family HAD-type hydrolase [Rhizobiaceae bacterium]